MKPTTKVNIQDKFSSSNLYEKFSTKRLCFLIFISLFSLAVLISALVINYSGRVFQNLSYIDPVTGEGIVKMAAFQYFTYLTFTSLTAYYILLTTLVMISKFNKRDVLFIEKLLNPTLRNNLMFLIITMFTLVILLLGPYSIYVFVSETSSSTPSTDGGSSISSTILTMLIHLVLPTIVFIEHFSFVPIKKMKNGSYGGGVLPPIIYMSYSLPIAVAQSNANGFSIYPYFFMDPEIMTGGGVISILIALYAISIPSTYTLYGIRNKQYDKSNGNKIDKYNLFVDIKSSIKIRS